MRVEGSSWRLPYTRLGFSPLANLMERGAPGNSMASRPAPYLCLMTTAWPDHVGRAVQQQRGGHAPGQRAVDGLVLVVEGVLHHHLRRDRTGGFVDVVIQRKMGVRIDEAGREILAAGIDHRGRSGSVDGLANGGDLAVLYIDAAVL